MKSINLKFLYISLISLYIFGLVSCTEQTKGPLRICRDNPRYFTDAEGKAIYLTGSHTWSNLTDISPSDPPEPFDFFSYLDWIQQYNHNFIRLWTWELVNWDTRGNRENKLHTAAPHPFARTGPGTALDGKPKFNLKKFNQVYFDRLRSRLEAARDRDIYVSIMLFEGWGLQFSPNAWENHPFHPDNNINGIAGDMDGDGKGLEVHTLLNPGITALQEAYVRKVIDTVNDMDNVLFEISNENHPPSTEWQYHIIDFIHNYEKNKPGQHPVGMTFQYRGGSNTALFESPADWISPNPEGGYRDNPPAADGSKVIITDTDHLWGVGGNQAWVWKSFLRGLNPIFMDPYDGVVLRKPFDPQWEPVRKSMGYALRIARQINLTDMVPDNDLASSTYCLANPGKEYLVYLPEGNDVIVDLTGITVSISEKWFNPNTEETKTIEPNTGGYKRKFISPFGSDDAVLHLKVL